MRVPSMVVYESLKASVEARRGGATLAFVLGMPESQRMDLGFIRQWKEKKTERVPRATRVGCARCHGQCLPMEYADLTALSSMYILVLDLYQTRSMALVRRQEYLTFVIRAVMPRKRSD